MWWMLHINGCLPGRWRDRCPENFFRCGTNPRQLALRFPVGREWVEG